MSAEQDKALFDLRREYRDLGVFKKTVRAQVKADFEVKIQQEIQSRIAAAEAEFSRHLAEKKEEYDLKVTEIQDEVLRSRTWSIWEKWRDLAEITPERERATSKRVEAAKPDKYYTMEDGDIWLVSGPEGALEPPISIDVRWDEYLQTWEVDVPMTIGAVNITPENPENPDYLRAVAVGHTVSTLFKVQKDIREELEGEGDE